MDDDLMRPDDPSLPLVTKLANALRVLVLNVDTHRYLRNHDPMALRQAEEALREYERRDRLDGTQT